MNDTLSLNERDHLAFLKQVIERGWNPPDAELRVLARVLKRRGLWRNEAPSPLKHMGPVHLDMLLDGNDWRGGYSATLTRWCLDHGVGGEEEVDRPLTFGPTLALCELQLMGRTLAKGHSLSKKYEIPKLRRWAIENDLLLPAREVTVHENRLKDLGGFLLVLREGDRRSIGNYEARLILTALVGAADPTIQPKETMTMPANYILSSNQTGSLSKYHLKSEDEAIAKAKEILRTDPTAEITIYQAVKVVRVPHAVEVVDFKQE